MGWTRGKNGGNSGKRSFREKMVILYSAISSPSDRSKRFTRHHLAWETCSHAVYCAKTVHLQFHRALPMYWRGIC